MQEKPWYQSKTIIGSLVAVAAVIVTALFQVTIDEAIQAQLVEAILSLVAVGGSIVAVIGRFTADKPIKGTQVNSASQDS